MTMSLNMTKVFLLSLSAIGFYCTWYLFFNNGGADMMNDVRDNGPHFLPFTDKAPLRKLYTGIASLDDQLTVLTLFFYNIVDGSHPHACLQAYHFIGQIVAGWGLLVLESLRYSNQWSIISFITIWGLIMQNATFAVVVPVYFAIHHSTSPTVSSRKPSNFLMDPIKLTSIPFSLAVGLVLPTVLLALPAPSIITHERKQLFIAIWQAFPLWAGILQTVVPFVRFSFMNRNAVEKAEKHTIESMRTVYACMLAVAVVTRISTWTIMGLSVLFPNIFAAAYVQLLNPSTVLRPVSLSPAVKMPSIAAGALQLLQYDEMVGAFAMVVWSSALYINAMEKRSLSSWATLFVEGVVIEALAGPQGFAVAAIWARDECIFAKEDINKKSI
ncbi:MAG: hypothetical protein Q9186_005788 [Xanthomendoza sp. 1 TL-2023]